MGKDIYEAIKPEKTTVKEKKVKVKKPVNKDSLIIGIVIAVIVLLTVGIVAYYFWGVNNEVLVTYDGGEITRGEYEAVYRYWAPQLVYYGYDADSTSKLIVDEILLNEVIYGKATEAGYKISDENKKTVDDNFANEDSVKALRASSINPEILKDFFYKNAVVSAYLKDIENAATVDEIKAAIIAEEGENADLNLYNTRHILIRVDTDATDEQKAEAKTKAEGLLKQIKNGKDFATLAKDNSDDSGTAQDGGVFKMVNNATVDEAYRKAVLSLKEGKVYSTVVESDFGYFIIKLESIEKNGRLTYDEQVEVYVNDFIKDTIDKVFSEEAHKAELERAAALASRLNSELGIASATTSEE